MTVEIKITHDGNMSNLDAIHATHAAVTHGAWKSDRSNVFWMSRSLDGVVTRLEVTDLKLDEKTNDRQLEVKLIEDK